MPTYLNLYRLPLKRKHEEYRGGEKNMAKMHSLLTSALRERDGKFS